MSVEKIKNVHFIYHRPDDYRIVYSNGIQGGISPRGDILCNFFLEHNEIPAEDNFEVMDGKLGKRLIEPKETIPITRDLKIGIVLKVEDAEDIAKWLLEKVKQIKGVKTEQTSSST